GQSPLDDLVDQAAGAGADEEREQKPVSPAGFGDHGWWGAGEEARGRRPQRHKRDRALAPAPRGARSHGRAVSRGAANEIVWVPAGKASTTPPRKSATAGAGWPS